MVRERIAPSVPSSRERFDGFAAGVWVLSLGLSCAFVLRGAVTVGDKVVFSLFDDAMISMRFAENLARGWGLVFNPGEPPVEGYTNFLWTVVMAGVHKLPLAREMRALGVSFIGVAVLQANALVSLRLAERAFPALDGKALRRSTLVAVALYYPLAFWTLRGFEVGLIALCVSLVLWLALRIEQRESWLAVAGLMATASAMVLCRVDAALPCGVAFVYLVFGQGDRRRARIAAVLLGLTVGATLAAHTWWRWRYYGQLLPNTYYLKVEHIPALDRLVRGAFMMMVVAVRHLAPWLLLGVLLARLAFRAKASRPVVLLAAVFLVQALYSVWVGGDVWERLGFTNRFLATVASPLLVLGAASVVWLARATREELDALRPVGIRVAVSGAVALAVVAVATLMTPRRLPMPFDALAQGRWILFGGLLLLAVLLAALARPIAAAAVGLAGRLGGQAALRPAVVLFVIQAPSWGFWLVDNFEMYEWDEGAVRSAFVVQSATKEGETIAVTAAGAIPYFSERRTIDLLGKSDPVIAHQKPRMSKFVPGHNKWDLAYSIGKLRPDVIVNLPSEVTPEERRYVEGLGYRPDAYGLLRRR